MSEMSVDPDQKTPGRGAVSNLAGRYERARLSYEDDGWPGEPGCRVLRTQVSCERPRRIVTYNRSPDLPFDRSVNPYRGCEHGCVYCFARPSHAFLGLSPGLDFETRLVARPGAAQVLARELSARSYKVATIAMGTNTDPYQPIERDYGITRGCLEVLGAFGHPVAIVTKGALIERDIDILAPMAAQGLVRVGVSLTTLDADLSRHMEPRAPTPARRLQMIERLSRAGIPVRVMTSPLVPGLTDHEMEAMLSAGRDAGATSASWIMLRLPREVSPLWQEWLGAHHPDRAGRVMGLLRDMHGGKDYDARWGRRMRGRGPYAGIVAARFKAAIRRLDLQERQPGLRSDIFAVPPRAGDQLEFFG